MSETVKTEPVHASGAMIPGTGPLAFVFPACGEPEGARPRLTQHTRNVTCDACLALLVEMPEGEQCQ